MAVTEKIEDIIAQNEGENFVQAVENIKQELGSPEEQQNPLSQGDIAAMMSMQGYDQLTEAQKQALMIKLSMGGYQVEGAGEIAGMSQNYMGLISGSGNVAEPTHVHVDPANLVTNMPSSNANVSLPEQGQGQSKDGSFSLAP